MRYFFHLIEDGGEEVPDDLGTELPSVATARTEALSALCTMATERMEAQIPVRSISLRIATGAGEHLGVLSLTFDEVPPDWVTRG